MDYGAALWAGIAGSLAILAIHLGFVGAGLTRLGLVRIQGGLVGGDEPPLVYVYGLIVHLAAGTLVALLYNLAFTQLPGNTYVGWGALLGLVHGLLALVIIQFAGRRSRPVRLGRLAAPGFGGRAYGRMTPLALVVAHVAYGVWVGALILPPAA